MTDVNKLIEFLDYLIDCLVKRKPVQRLDKKLIQEIKEIVEGEPILRRLLWRRHGCPHPALYGDDGQVDCNSCIIDFKDTPAKDIERRFQHIGELKLKQHRKLIETKK